MAMPTEPQRGSQIRRRDPGGLRCSASLCSSNTFTCYYHGLSWLSLLCAFGSWFCSVQCAENSRMMAPSGEVCYSAHVSLLTTLVTLQTLHKR
jgi:hypothetical protein